MIKLEELNNVNYENIMSDVKDKIKIFTDDWNNTQEYDPGITLIELFTWLKLSQVQYINTFPKSSYFAFLELIGIKRRSNKGSETLISLENVNKNIKIPKGTKWATENLTFENLAPEELNEIKIEKLGFSNPETEEILSYEKLDGNRLFSIFGTFSEKGDDRKFTLYMKNGISKGCRVNLYVDIHNKEKVQRVPILPEDDFKPMVSLRWEFYGIVDFEEGWHRLDLITDETHDFLFSGIVQFKVPGDMVPIDGMYRIRVSMSDGEYDFPPIMKKIIPNVIRVRQQNTLCEPCDLVKKDMNESYEVEIFSNLALYGNNEVYVHRDGFWTKIYDFNYERDIQKGCVKFNFKNLESELKKFNDDDLVLRIVSFDKSLTNGTSVGSGTGTSLQRININYDNVYYDNFGLMVGREVNGKYYFDDWEKVECFVSSNKYSKHYILNTDLKVVGFGNHVRGMVPYKGVDNVRVNKLVVTDGDNSNIRSHMIRSVRSENKDILGLKIEQFVTATGGLGYETVDDMKRRVYQMVQDGDRAVTIKDYERFVRKTPGLIIDNVKVLPSYYPRDTEDPSRCVTIVIRGSEKNKSVPLKGYRENILNHLEKYKLLNTKLEVIVPVYTGITVSGKVVLNSCSSENKKIINDAISKFISDLNKEWGKECKVSTLFGIIDRLDIVSYVEDLKFIPKGNYVRKSQSGDVIIKPYGAYYLEKVDLLLIN